MLLFLLPPDSGEKITLGVTILLAFFVNSLVVSNYTPEATSDLPVIGNNRFFNNLDISLVDNVLKASIMFLISDSCPCRWERQSVCSIFTLEVNSQLLVSFMLSK